VEISLSRIASLLAFGGALLMIVIGVYVFVESSFGAVFIRQTILSGAVTILCGVVALIGWNRLGGMIWPIVLIIAGAVGGGAGGVLVAIGGILGIASESRDRLL
jgi:hypothetical protein